MRLLFLAIALAVSVGTYARASNWDGEYSGECEGGTQFECELILKDVGKHKVEADLTVTERAKDTNVKCRLHGMFKQSGKALHGDFGPSIPDIQFTESDSGVSLRGTDGKAKDCGVKMDGEFYIMGE